MKKIFVVDWALLAIFIVTVFSGFKLHIVGHFSSHDVWHSWAICHTVASFVFLFFGVLHVQTHWGWYRTLISRGLGKKSRITVWLSFIFCFAAITGVLLLNIDGANSEMGLWHYRIGILLSIIGFGHFIKRFPMLKKSILNRA